MGLFAGGLPGAKPGGAPLRQAEAVPPGRDSVREAQGDVPGTASFSPRLHPNTGRRKRQHNLVEVSKPFAPGHTLVHVIDKWAALTRCRRLKRPCQHRVRSAAHLENTDW